MCVIYDIVKYQHVSQEFNWKKKTFEKIQMFLQQ